MRIWLFLLIGTLSLNAGPIANLRTENGATARVEIVYVDDSYYYCKRVAEPKERILIPIENVPSSLRLHVRGLVKKGELTAPPQGGARPPSPGGGSAPWIFTDNDDPNDHRFGKYLIVEGVSNAGNKPTLNFRFRRNQYRAFIHVGFKVTLVNHWQVTYRIDDREPVTELLDLNDTGTTLFFPRPFHFRDQLKGATNLLVVCKDSRGHQLQMLFDVRGFAEQIEKIDGPLGLGQARD